MLSAPVDQERYTDRHIVSLPAITLEVLDVAATLRYLSRPAETARVARAIFPDGNLVMRIYDELGLLFQDRDFADLFPIQGQPAEAPLRLALVTLLQFMEGLTDRQAADAVRTRIDWKYLLCLELTDPGFDHSVLSEYRTRLLAHGAERRLFDTILTYASEHDYVKAGGRQHSDSTHVLGAMHVLSRMEVAGETLRHTLNILGHPGSRLAARPRSS